MQIEHGNSLEGDRVLRERIRVEMSHARRILRHPPGRLGQDNGSVLARKHGGERAQDVHLQLGLERPVLRHHLALFRAQHGVNGGAGALAAEKRNGKTLPGSRGQLQTHDSPRAVARAYLHAAVEAGAVVLDLARDWKPRCLGDASIADSEAVADKNVEYNGAARGNAQESEQYRANAL